MFNSVICSTSKPKKFTCKLAIAKKVLVVGTTINASIKTQKTGQIDTLTRYTTYTVDMVTSFQLFPAVGLKRCGNER